MRRIKDFRSDWDYTVTEPVASNFYPVNFAASIRERTRSKKYENKDYSTLSDQDRILTVFNERAQAAGAMREGEIMINMQRSTIKDDHHGAKVPLYETSSNSQYFKIYHYISVNQSHNQNNVYDYINFRPIYFNNNSNLVLHKESVFAKVVNTDCLVNIQVLTKEKFFVQLFNRNDPYFSLKRETCEYSFYQVPGLSFSIKEVEKHGADYGQIKTSEGTVNNKRGQRRSLKFLNEANDKIEPQEFRLFLLELAYDE